MHEFGISIGSSDPLQTKLSKPWVSKIASSSSIFDSLQIHQIQNAQNPINHHDGRRTPRSSPRSVRRPDCRSYPSRNSHFRLVNAPRTNSLCRRTSKVKSKPSSSQPSSFLPLVYVSHTWALFRHPSTSSLVPYMSVNLAKAA